MKVFRATLILALPLLPFTASHCAASTAITPKAAAAKTMPAPAKAQQKAQAPQDKLAAAKAAFDKQDYRTALARLKPQAERGNAQAQYLAALCCQRGSKGFDADPKQAFDWMGKAARQGDAQAQLALAVMYYDGKGTEFSHKDAAEWFGKAAEQGLPEAQFNYGFMFSRGRGVEKDFTKAQEWWLKAARQGHADAMLFTGSLYEHGDGVAQSDVEAMKWYILATNNGAELAKEFQAKIQPKLNKKELASARQAAQEFRSANPAVH